MYFQTLVNIYIKKSMKKLTNEEVIEKIKKVWGDKYDLSKVNYSNAREKITVICKKHGEFKIKLHDLLNGHGCKKCAFNNVSKKKVLTLKEFIEKSEQVHNHKYDYSKVEYINNRTKVCIICPEHGEFWQTPNSHLSGFGCAKCSEKNKKTAEEFIKKAKEIHGNRYDYSKVEYINNKTKVCIICPEHGEFWQTPNAHLLGQGCKLCNKPVYNTKTFISEAKKIHGDKYDYSKVDYVNAKTKVCIICPEHGEFWQNSCTHISQKCGCPVCNISHLESMTMNFLNENNVKYEYRKHFSWLNKQHLDFYLPEYNVAIECQGIQHYEPIAFFGGKKGLEYRLELDYKKKTLCEQNNVKLIYINNENEINSIIYGL